MDNQFMPQRRHRKDAESSFKTPEQVAATDEHATATPIVDTEEQHEYSHPPARKTEPVKKNKKRFKFNMSRRTILIVVCALLVLAGGGLAAYLNMHKSSLDINKNKIASLYKPVSKTVASNLSGLQVDPNLNKLPVTAVMVENSIDARPQSGLSQAMVVFEAIAEGGVTRFMALYQDTSPSSIGPVRSARPYYVSWALGFDAAYAHVGGSADALSDITSWGVKDMNQFYNGNYYSRISTREAPHNVYTSISSLNQLEAKKGYSTSHFTSWTRKKATPLVKPTTTAISMSLSGYYYDPSYTYVASTNSYNRSEAGAAQMDANTNAQISPKVVIAIVVPESQGALDATGAYYSDYNVIGTNTAYVFQDGGVTVGQWTKSSNNSQIVFTTSDGKPLALDPGQVWITAITSTSGVTYS